MSTHEDTKPNCGRDVIHQNIILPWVSQRWLCSSDANNPGEILLINSENIHREHNTLITLKPTKNWTEAGVENKGTKQDAGDNNRNHSNKWDEN